MMKVLLTGAGGFVGHHTLEHILKTTDWEVVCLESFRHKGMSARLRDVAAINKDQWHRVTVITHDLIAPIDHVTKKEIGNIDVIINMASESHVDRSLVEPRHFITNNVALALNMLEYAREIKPSLFIQISTDEVYGPAKHGDHPEYDPILPSNPYSGSKAAQEAIAISYWRSYDVPVVISNTMNMFGERQDVEKFIPKTIRHFRNKEATPIHGLEINGVWKSGSRFYLHARNQADALVFIAKHHVKHPIKYSEGLERPERFHVGGEREVSNEEMATMIASLMGLTEGVIERIDVGTTRPGHDLRYGLERNTLEGWGWKSPLTFEESFSRTVHWTLDHPEWLN
jgi:dTDP-glucose 4,6-dehydratase